MSNELSCIKQIENQADEIISKKYFSDSPIL